MPTVEPRYAGALLAAAPSPQAADDIGKALEDFCGAMTGDLHAFLLGPIVSGSVKKETIRKILTPDTPQLAVNFLLLLVDKNRLALLPGICSEYARQKAETRGTLVITVTSAQRLEEAQLTQIRDRYAKKHGASSVQVNSRVDSSLLGGVRVQVGDVLIDDSLSTRLRGLRTAMNNEH